MRNQDLREAIEDFSFGLLSTALDLSISLIAITGSISTTRSNPASVWRALEELSARPSITKDSLKQAFWRAKNQGLLTRKQARGKIFWILTEQGKKRLTSTFPIYLKVRPWDKRLYLITYDIPEEQRAHRMLLQKVLRQLGAGQLQKSIYLLLWDPREVIKDFIRDHELSGMVIVSNTGTDGSIGEKSLDELVWKVFRLEEVNSRYAEFIRHYQQKQLPSMQLAFQYLSILKDDPQLPFELLSPIWTGTKANGIFNSLISTKEIS